MTMVGRKKLKFMTMVGREKLKFMTMVVRKIFLSPLPRVFLNGKALTYLAVSCMTSNNIGNALPLNVWLPAIISKLIEKLLQL